MKNAYLRYGRFIGVANLIYGIWLMIATVINTNNDSYGAGLLAVFYLVGPIGMVGSTVFLLSLDGGQRYRTALFLPSRLDRHVRRDLASNQRLSSWRR